MFRIFDGRNAFFQWDLNRKLIVDDISVNEVHFCNRTDDCSLVCEVKNDGQFRVVDVPNILLQDNFKINVYAYDGEATKHSASFGVIARSKPADYIYTETEVKNYEEYVERLAALEEDVNHLEEEISVVYEQVKDLDVSADIEEYVRNHVETIDAWQYSKANLGNKRLRTLPASSADRVLTTRVSKITNVNGGQFCATAEIRLYVAEYYNSALHPITDINHPFEVKINPNTNNYAVYGREHITDGAIMIGDTDNIYKFLDIIEDTVDGTTFTSGNVETFSSKSGATEYALSVGISMNIYSPHEQAIDGLVAQFSQYLSATTHALIYYHNEPLNIVVGG